MDTRKKLQRPNARRLATVAGLGLLATISVSATATANNRSDGHRGEFASPESRVFFEPVREPALVGPRFYGERAGFFLRPSVGVYVGVLPPFYSTLWFDGLPYYYADDTFYLWRPDREAYEVVVPPGGAPVAATQSAASSDTNLFIYPKNRQSEELQAKDRYECSAWATGQTGFDPTKGAGGVSITDAAIKRGEYLRAETACLEARDYGVR
jgi:hypothetical protein